MAAYLAVATASQTPPQNQAARVRQHAPIELKLPDKERHGRHEDQGDVQRAIRTNSVRGYQIELNPESHNRRY